MYPFLRPTWEPVKDDQHYFILQVSPDYRASIKMVKGKNWTGLQEDKEGYLDNLVKIYLKGI